MKKKNSKKTKSITLKTADRTVPENLVSDIRKMIDDARSAVAVTVNAGMTMLYWQIGKRIRNEILGGKRAEYGQEIVVSLA